MKTKPTFAVIATAGGTTNAGIIDDLDGIANLCEEKGLWFHIDAAYGGGALASQKVRNLFSGIEKADSINDRSSQMAFTTYDCGAVIYKTRIGKRSSFSARFLFGYFSG